jgi:hypothetical protein
MLTFFGIKVPLENVKLLYKTLKKDKKSIFKVYLCENTFHNKTDGEPIEETVERCTGFVGLFRESLKPVEIPPLLKEFEGFLQEKKIFEELKISVTNGAEVYPGIPHQVLYYLEDLPRENDSEDEDDDVFYYKADDEYYNDG